MLKLLYKNSRVKFDTFSRRYIVYLFFLQKEPIRSENFKLFIFALLNQSFHLRTSKPKKLFLIVSLLYCPKAFTLRTTSEIGILCLGVMLQQDLSISDMPGEASGGGVHSSSSFSTPDITCNYKKQAHSLTYLIKLNKLLLFLYKETTEIYTTSLWKYISETICCKNW